jgi:hypothetical protein
MGLAGNVAHIGEMRNKFFIYVKQEEKVSLVRLCRREDDIEADDKEIVNLGYNGSQGTSKNYPL